MSATSPSPDALDNESLLEQARHEAQQKIAELHLEEGTVKSEGGQNSPSPEDVIPHQAPEEAP
ncbi:hypothetical protein RCH10_003335 [Variovorax sp. GrIS 2.14]|uniref:hypothetical protein n=1 Tax=Variovorax sp. GrIS 2.14 TaxID=3071709 RepID=UPI0038F6F2F5